MFPLINHIDDVLPHIKNNPNFSVNQKSDYTVIDYIINLPDLFGDNVQKECRGLIFDTASGKLLRRPLHKFFNYNERLETQNVDFSKPHVILEKLDGSMVTLLYTDGDFKWTSKAGVTFITDQINDFQNSYGSKYEDFAIDMFNLGYTAIFEWCSRKNRIVIDHPVDKLVLIAIRNNETGIYQSYKEMLDLSFYKYNIECVKAFRDFPSMEDLAWFTKGLKGAEGFVVRFDDGLWIKVKADEYLKFHRARDSFNSEKRVIDILVSGLADDFRTSLSEEDRKLFENFEKDFWIEVKQKSWMIETNIRSHQKANTSRKDFALSYKPLYSNQNWMPIMFRFYDDRDFQNQDIFEEIIRIIKSACSKQSKVDEKRSLWGGLHWMNYYHSVIPIE